MVSKHCLVIAFQGAPGAFSHRAAQIFAQDRAPGEKLEIDPCKTFEEIYDHVLAGRATHGAVPLENSSVGSITANYDLLWKKEVTIVGEVFLPVHHHLLGFKGTPVKELTTVYSHPVALDQCRKFLEKTPQLKPIAFWDTSGSAFHVKEARNKRHAAIASEFAAKETGLSILKRHVEDHAGNNTRFGIIEKSSSNKKNENGSAASAPSAYKLSVVAQLSHEPGSLAKLLSAIAAAEVNLTKIESRPIPEQPWHYRFYLDAELKSESQEKPILKALTTFADPYKILGRYRTCT